MKEKIVDALEGKRVLIWGYGREGKSSEDFIKEHCKNTKVTIFEGKREDIVDDDYDIVLKSPGIVMEEENPKFSSQTILFMNQFRDQTIGVTGTKGKSTTSCLLYEGLKSAGKKCVLLGNIGLPCFNYVDEIDRDTVVVFELSCHQLAHLEDAPKYSIFLNLYPEHLDYYGTVEKYAAAKANIITHQGRGDYCLVGDNVPELQAKSSGQVVKTTSRQWKMSILGSHNCLNAEFAFIMLTDIIGLDADKVIPGIEGFKGLPHRLQLLGEKNGVRYIDDSISTIPEAAISATYAVPDTATLLIGGMDRGIDYSKLVNFIKASPEYNFILMYSSGERIYKEVSGCTNVTKVADLPEAVEMAERITPLGKACLLSPAAASYGYFKNFEERGDIFRELLGL